MTSLSNSYDNIIVITSDDDNDHILIESNQCFPMFGDDLNANYCELCFDNDKDGQIEPCGHIACYKCLTHPHVKSCPFCRSMIYKIFLLA